MLPVPAGETWQEHYKLEFRELLNYGSTVFQAECFLQERVINSLSERSFLVTSKNIFSPFSSSQSWEEPLGVGSYWRCLEEKGKLPIPDPTHPSSPVPPPCKWEGDTRTNANKSLLYLAIIECLLDARSFYRQWKYVGKDPALGRCSLNVC